MTIILHNVGIPIFLHTMFVLLTSAVSFPCAIALGGIVVHLSSISSDLFYVARMTFGEGFAIYYKREISYSCYRLAVGNGQCMPNNQTRRILKLEIGQNTAQISIFYQETGSKSRATPLSIDPVLRHSRRGEDRGGSGWAQGGVGGGAWKAD